VIMDAITGPFPAQAPHLARLPFPALQEIIGRALMDPDFQSRLLNGGRQEIAATGSLSDRERVILLSVQATTLTDLAKAILDQYPPADSLLTRPVPLAYCG
jgi:hypothetical protein